MLIFVRKLIMCFSDYVNYIEISILIFQARKTIY
jgi:hypothetical protein